MNQFEEEFRIIHSLIRDYREENHRTILKLEELERRIKILEDER